MFAIFFFIKDSFIPSNFLLNRTLNILINIETIEIRVRILGQHQACLVVSVSASHAVGPGFTLKPGHTKDS